MILLRLMLKEIKPQNKVPVQTTEEPAEVEAEEVKPQEQSSCSGNR